MTSPQSNARYLLRFDDLCPTMGRAQWARFSRLIAEYNLKPILAVVPDNQDPELVVDSPDPIFWESMRALQSAGATIGLHGLQHICNASGGGLIPLHQQTEFAGVPQTTQQQWIRKGLQILRSHGLDPQIWVAPRHGFDDATIAALLSEDLSVVSDGFAQDPFKDRGILWIPQQLWSPVEKPSGVWTICLHANSASNDLCEELHRFLTRFSAQFTSVDQLLSESPFPARTVSDRLFHWRLLTRIRCSRWKRQTLRKLSHTT